MYMGFSDIWNISNKFEILNPENLIYGTFLFAIPLMSILFVHEMGHYFISKKHGISTSLPFFMPIPPIIPSFNIGTFGALISSSDPMPNKKALFDIGLAGPLTGFIIAIPITIIGLSTSDIIPITEVARKRADPESLFWYSLSDIRPSGDYYEYEDVREEELKQVVVIDF